MRSQSRRWQSVWVEWFLVLSTFPAYGVVREAHNIACRYNVRWPVNTSVAILHWCLLWCFLITSAVFSEIAEYMFPQWKQVNYVMSDYVMHDRRIASQRKKNFGALVRQRIIPNEHPPLVGEVSAKFSG
jgi:hypothetical protein